jgi:hypothetical protein
MRFKIFIIIIILGLTNLVKAQNEGPGNTGLAFLKFGVGANSIGMGEAFSSYSKDATAIIYNPARIVFGLNNSVVLMHNASAEDLTNDFIGAKVIIGKIGLGFGILKSGVDNIEIRTQPGAVIDKFSSQNLSMNLSIGYKVNDNVSIGITSKLLYEKIYIDEASGLGFDIGANYSKDNTNFAFVISNLGSMNELRNSETKLPTSVRFGGSFITPLNNFTVGISIDGFKILDGGKLHILGGGELSYRDFISLRLGYQTNYENKGLTTGLGFKYKNINLDYAFIPYTGGFGTGNTFSLCVTF